ncbi:MAG: PAS domain-containing protein [Candidatus Geothermincolia bacterium]
MDLFKAMGTLKHLSVLVVEDDPIYAATIRLLLRTRFEAEVIVAADCRCARNAYSNASFDLITLDYQLPDGDGLQFLEEIRGLEEPPPVVMVTAHGDEKVAVNSFKIGAAGYVVKDKWISTLLPETVRSVLEREESRKSLRESESRFRLMFDNMSSGVAVYDAVGDGEDFVIVDFNKAAERIEKIGREEVVGSSVLQVFPGIREFGLLEVLRRVWRTGEPEDHKIALYSDERISSWRENFVYKLHSGEIVAIYDDVSERVRVEESLAESLEEWTATFDAVSESIFLVDAAFTIIKANEAVSSVLDRPNEGIIGRKCYQLIHGLEAPPDDCPVLRAVRGAKICSSERYEAHLGRYIELSVSPIFDSGGSLRFAVNMIRDITERKDIELALRASELKYRTLYESSQDGISAVDLDGHIIECNDAFTRMLGYTFDELQSLSFYDITPVRWHEYNKKVVRKIMNEGYSEPFEKEYVRKDGTVFPISIRTWLMKDDRGNPTGMWAITRDITERKMADAKLEGASSYNRNLIETSLDPLVTIDPDGKISDVNAATEKITGRSREELIGTDFHDYFSDPKKAREGYQRVFREGSVRDYPLEIRHAKGNTVPVLYNASIYRDKSGEVIGVFAAARDITKLKEAERALREREARLKAIAEGAMDAIFLIDSEGMIRHWNPAAENLYGFAAEEAIGQSLVIILPEPVRGARMSALEKFICLGLRTFTNEEPTEMSFIGKHRPEFPVEISVSRLQIENCWYAEVIARDITDRKRGQDALQHANVELEGYAHTVSHDLRGPISAGSVVFDMLLSEFQNGGIADEKAEMFCDALELGRANMANAMSLIEDLLSLAETGKPEEVLLVNIETAVNKVLAENAEEIRERGITVNVVSPLGEVVASPTHIYQAFANLIGNSIKHCESESPLIEISCLGMDGPAHRFLVRDNGRGIPAEVLARVFMPFVKAESGGTGIGLSIVEKIVETYGGRIRAYNDNGACFEFTLMDYDKIGP